MGGVGVGDLEADAGEGVGGGGPGVVGSGPFGERQQDLAGADGRTAVGERYGQAGEPVRVDAGEAVVQPPPPARVLLQAGQPVHGLGERDAGDTQGPQLHPAFQPGGQQAGDHLGEDAHGVGTGALDDLGVARPQGVRVLRDLRETDPGPGCVALALGPVRRSVLVLGLRDGGRQEGGTRQPVQDRLAQGAVQLALAERAGHEVDDPGVHRAPGGEEFGVGVRGALHQERGERAGRGVAPGGVEREGGDEEGRHAEGFVAGRGRVHDGAGTGPGGRAVLVHRDGPGHRPVRAQALLDRAVGEEGRVEGAGGRRCGRAWCRGGSPRW